MDVLLNAGADPNIVSSSGWTALCSAIQSADKDMAMIDNLCAVTTTNEGREEVFHMIAKRRLAMSGPLVTYVINSLCSTGRECKCNWRLP